MVIQYNTVKQAVCDENGDLNTYLPIGMCEIAAYKDGYLPTELTLFIYNDQDNNIAVTLDKGDLITCEMVSHRMSIQEILEAGININDPMNMDSYVFQFEATFEKKAIPTTYRFFPMFERRNQFHG